MKKKYPIVLLLVLIIIVFVVVSCSGVEVYDTPTNDSGSAVVNIQLKTTGTTSKSVDTQTQDGEYSVINSAAIYFLDSYDVMVFWRELTEDEVSSIQNTSTTAGNKQLTIEGVPSTARYLIFVANCATNYHPDFVPMNSTTSRSTYRLDSLQAGGVSTVPLFDRSATFTLESEEPLLYSVEVVLEPVVARLEVGAVSFTQQTPLLGADFSAFKLGGLYLNNIRPRVMINGMAYSDAPVDARDYSLWDTQQWSEVFGSTTFPYLSEAPDGWVSGALQTVCAPVESALKFYPSQETGATSTQGNDELVWAYNITPSSNTEVGVVSADIPHIILRLTDVEYVNRPTGSTEQYVVVTGYRNSDGTTLEGFENGCVYRITDLAFEYDNATNNPYDPKSEVMVTVSVKPWSVTEVLPNF